jgi:hypothetical protein
MSPENLLAFFGIAAGYGSYPLDRSRIEGRIAELRSRG